MYQPQYIAKKAATYMYPKATKTMKSLLNAQAQENWEAKTNKKPLISFNISHY